MTGNGPAAELRRRLGPGCKAVDALDAAQKAKFIELLDAARAQQERNLYRALSHSLDFLPSVLRGPVRRLFRG